MIVLTGSPSPRQEDVEAELAAIAVRPVLLSELGAGKVLEIEVAGWLPEEVAEVLAPIVDQRIRVDDAAAYLSGVDRLHRLVIALDSDDQVLSADVAELHAVLGDQLRRDCETSGVWDSWGIAACMEDDAERPTVSPCTLDWLTQIEAGAGRSPDADPRGSHHAGALHTYGYLCSSLWTKYGRKRTRWVGGNIAVAAGVDAALLQPVPRSGTLLSNATTLATRLLGWDEPADGEWNEKVRPTALLLGRVVEVAAASVDLEGETRPLDEPIEIRTSLFRRSDPPPNNAPNLLVYSFVKNGVERLVTMFDVGDAKVEELLGTPSVELGDGVPIRLRYNAVVGELGTQFTGSRRIERSGPI